MPAVRDLVADGRHDARWLVLFEDDDDGVGLGSVKIRVNKIVATTFRRIYEGTHPRVLDIRERRNTEGGRWKMTKHHRFLLSLHLNQIDALEAAMATIDAQVEANLAPFRTAVEQIMSIPGFRNLGAQVVVLEIGIDMSRFASAPHLISRACICPRNDESVGKRSSA
jgi:transposase